MTVETTTDRAGLFSTDDWGQAATFTPDGGAAVAVTVIFSRAAALEDLGFAGVTAPSHRALLRVSEVASPAPGDVLVIGSQTFTVDQVDGDEIGAINKLWLAEQ
jgi:hypothetical protein